MPGVGKSTIGRRVARELGWSFIDLDHEIERQAGCSIAAFFSSRGEASFRDLEAQVLRQFVATETSVLATGGGAVLRADNRHLLRDATQCVYLRATPEFLWARLKHDRRRPLLQGGNAKERLWHMAMEREPLYVAAAQHVIDVEPLTLSMTVEAICARLG
jgi:shikimate kinase